MMAGFRSEGYLLDVPKELKQEPVDQPCVLPGAEDTGPKPKKARKSVPKRTPKAKPYRATKKGAKVGNLTVASLASSSLLADIQQVADSPAQHTFESGQSREKALKSLQEKAGEGEEEIFRNDTKLVNTACSELGVPFVKPHQGGLWKMPGMITPLKPHQLLGLNFAVKVEKRSEKPNGGIIADHMGLGKTVVALALIIRGKSHTSIHGTDEDLVGQTLKKAKTTLIVCPASITSQWFEEINKHCATKKQPTRDKHKEGIPRYKIYKSNIDDDQNDALNELAAYDVLITTYDEVRLSFPLQDPPKEIVDHFEREAWWEQFFAEKKGHLHSIHFKRVILDEAHLIRNPMSHRSRACRALSSQFRWCLTATPMTNGAADLWTLFDFAKMPMEESYETFKTRFIKKRDDESDFALENMINRCMIQRRHKDKLFNRRIVHLPPTNTKVLKVNFNKVEKEVYDIVAKRFIARLNRISELGEFTKRTSHIWTMITRLRQLTSHPLIIQGPMLDLLNRDDIERLRSVLREYVDENREHGKALIHQIRILLERRADEHDGQGKQVLKVTALDASMEDAMVQEATESKSTGSRHGIQYKFNRFLDKLKDQNKKLEMEAIMECVYCRNRAENAQISSCLHIYCQSCLDEAQEDAAYDGLPGAACHADDCGQIFSSVEPAGDHARLLALEQQQSKQGKKKSKLPDGIPDWLDEAGEMIPSAKTLAVKAQILEWKKIAPHDKIILFTNWIPMIKVLGSMCKLERWEYLVYSSDLSQKARAKAISTFSTSPTCKILISGLQCGSLGLNLTMANRAICVDQWWNNAVEDQAFGRVYRINQEKDTAYLQLLVNNSIDERLETIKKNKQSEIDEFSKGRLKLTQREIMGLFGDVIEDVNGTFRIEEASVDSVESDDDE
ncbi:hypothetical protein K461DRAFT_241503 [Myriangium duriaei CBS 260.36]|uniref:Uncharacterized protein n=1 Tax=Myriangium duriaei CBS 260.36 TaxID=1168546 RepID=A0A9P4MJS2_9PEZI|nr:hypothetical protein K461DRAFT_241503 [Myriangium duriaei CBS 260.36]